MTYIEALRAIYAKSNAAKRRKIDDDLDAEAGMHGDYATLLQAARDMDTSDSEPMTLTIKGRGTFTFERCPSELYALTFEDEQAHSWPSDAEVSAACGFLVRFISEGDEVDGYFLRVQG